MSYNIEIGSDKEPWTIEQQERLKVSCKNTSRPYPVRPLTRQRAGEYLSALQGLGMDASMKNRRDIGR